MYEFNWSFLWKYRSFFSEGVLWTLAIAAIAVLIGIVLGTVLALMRLSRFKALRFLSVAYVEFIRGTPVMVQIYIIFYGMPLFLGIDGAPRFVAGSIAMGLNSAAYVAEIIRGGIQAVDRGQTEAARSLGMGTSLTMIDIILPQAIRTILPALGNEFVIVIKESSVVSIIGVTELMYKTKTVMGNSYRQFEPLIVASIIYFILTFTLSKLLGLAERRMNVGYSDTKAANEQVSEMRDSI